MFDKLGRVDKALLGYIGLLNTALLVWRPPDQWLSLFLVHSAIAGAIVWLARGALQRPSRAARFLHLWYPQLCFLLFFEEVHRLVHFIRAGWFDSFFIAFDHRLFGVHPTLWLEQHSTPELTEWMNMFYFSYYFMIPVVGGLLHYRKQFREFETMMFASVLGYATCYAVFYLLPVEGPHHTLRSLQRVELRGGFFTALMAQIEKYGSIHGGAFPSAHVVGAVVPWLVAWKHARKLAIWMTPFALGVMVSTVYVRYHYAADVFGGVLVAAVAYAIASRYENGLASVSSSAPPSIVNRQSSIS